MMTRSMHLKQRGIPLWGVMAFLCLTACAEYARNAHAAGENETVAEGDYEGKVLIPDPDNYWTGFKSTGEKCFARVHRHAPGSLAVQSGFNEETVIVHTDGIPGESFYMGRFGDGQALVLQLLGPSRGAVALTHTTFDDKGRLNYGSEGDGDFTRECMIGSP